MAKNTGLIKFTGKLGGLSGRETAFGNVIQTPGGFKGERVKTEARYEKTRQLYTEFGRCATISSLLKGTLDFYLRLLPDPYVYNHIQKRIVAIKGCDTASPKGDKTTGKGLQTEQGAAMLSSFSFNRKRHWHFGGTATHRLDLQQGILTLEGVAPAQFKFPGSADQVGFQLLVLRFDFENIACTMTQSAFSFVGKEDKAAGVILDAGVPDGEGVLIAVVFVGFCSVRNGEVSWRRYVGNALDVVGVG